MPRKRRSSPIKPRKKREGRPQAPPPALMGGAEGVEGNSILEEVSGGPGILLWQSLRDATLWGRAPEPRTGLFVEGQERARLEEIVRWNVEAPLIGPLTTVSRVLGSATPPEPAEVAKACRAISVWADGQRLPRTALAFAQAAAVVAPEDAAAAYRVGWLARRLAEYPRAESWFRRAIGLARLSEDRETYALAYIGLGNLYIQRGDCPSAREALLRAYRTARRASLRQPAAMALHDLFMIAAHGGETSEAVAYAAAALRAYGPRHRNLHKLAHDVAWFWMLRGDFSHSLPVFKAVLARLSAPSEVLLATSTVARSASGAGDLMTFVDAWNETWRLVDSQRELEHIPEALLHLAYAASYQGDVERVEMAVGHAVTVAKLRGESKVIVEAEELLEAVRTAEFVRPEASPAKSDAEVQAAESLAEGLVRALVESAAER